MCLACASAWRADTRVLRGASNSDCFAASTGCTNSRPAFTTARLLRFRVAHGLDLDLKFRTRT
jgi:hypothetical protein